MVPENVSDSAASNRLGIPRPPYLHEKEVQDSVRVVSLIAAGRNPFSTEPFDKLRPEQKESILQALCIVVSALANSGKSQPSAESSWSPSSASVANMSKRPLEEYLNQVERQAILEALEEAKYNKTAAARLLGITFRALRYRLENLGIDAGND